ncbi:hypothetical protein CHUAL_013711 [Chamberlinius hualienensis]
MASNMRYGNHLIVNEDAFKRRSSQVFMENSHNSIKSVPESVSLDDIYFYKTGIRGRKKYLLYVVIILLFLIALANIITTFALMGVLRLAYGLESLEFIPKGLLIRFLENCNIDVVIPANGLVGGFKGEDLNIYGNNQPIMLKTKHAKPTSVVVSPDETVLHNVNSFRVVDPRSGQQIFSTEYGEFGLPKAVKKLNVHHVTANKITSPVNRPLSLDADTQIRMRGNEGLHMMSSELILTAGEDVYLKSRNGTIVLDGNKGVILNVAKLPRASDSLSQETMMPYQYKICVCIPSGQIHPCK